MKKFSPLQLPPWSMNYIRDVPGVDEGSWNAIMEAKSWKGQLPDHDRYHQPILWTADLASNMAYSPAKYEWTYTGNYDINSLDDLLAAHYFDFLHQQTQVPVVWHYPRRPCVGRLPRVILLQVGGQDAWPDVKGPAWRAKVDAWLLDLKAVFDARATDLDRAGVVVILWRSAYHDAWGDVGYYNWLLMTTPAQSNTLFTSFGDDYTTSYYPVIEPSLWLAGDVSSWIILTGSPYTTRGFSADREEGNFWTYWLTYTGGQDGPWTMTDRVAATGQAYQDAAAIYESLSTWVGWWGPTPIAGESDDDKAYREHCKADAKLACDACGPNLTYQDFGQWDPTGAAVVQAVGAKLDSYLS